MNVLKHSQRGKRNTSRQCKRGIKRRGSPFSVECPTQLHDFVTKEVMSNEIKTYLIQSAQEIHTERLLNKRAQLQDTIYVQI